VDALTLLKQDHREVKALFAEVEELGERADASRAKLFAKIDEALTLHARCEEAVFYPALKEKASARSEERDEVMEAYEEHGVVKSLIKQLENLDPTDESYKAKLTVLIENVEHHVKEEEGSLFKVARELLSEDELEEIGQKIEAMKEKAAA
jgi:hemerythrin superfamily protein